jgi:hypothetical protein
LRGRLVEAARSTEVAEYFASWAVIQLSLVSNWLQLGRESGGKYQHVQ